MNQEMGMEFPSMREWIFYEKDHLSWSTRGKIIYKQRSIEQQIGIQQYREMINTRKELVDWVTPKTIKVTWFHLVPGTI
jgi:hypothetical protein